MAEEKAVIGLSWNPSLTSFTSPQIGRPSNHAPQTSNSLLYKPESHLIVPPKKLNKLARKQIKDTTGKNWFNMPVQTLTPELKKDLQLLKLRGAMDPKRFYKKGDSRSKALPKYFQVGTVIEPSTEFYTGRLTNKERKATLADELLSDGNLWSYRKRKVREIEEVKRTVGMQKWKKKNNGKKRRH